MSQELFLSRASDYYKSLCQSIGPPVSRSVGLSVRWSVSYPNNLSSTLKKKMLSINFGLSVTRLFLTGRKSFVTKLLWDDLEFPDIVCLQKRVNIFFVITILKRVSTQLLCKMLNFEKKISRIIISKTEFRIFIFLYHGEIKYKKVFFLLKP